MKNKMLIFTEKYSFKIYSLKKIMNAMKIHLMRLFSIFFGTFLLFAYSCNSSQEEAVYDNKFSDSLETTADTEPQAENKDIIIYYTAPSPLEMATLMRRDNSAFYPDLLSPTENLDRFMTNSSIALNIGVYGVDLSYAKIFQQEQLWRNYLSAVKELSDKLGIPEDESASSYGSIEESITDTDSLLTVINDTYNSATTYLRDNDRESTATLIILGGWIEAMYISTNLYQREENSEDIMNRIIVQKFSLNYMLELVSENQDDRTVAQFMDHLRRLKRVYDNIEIRYNKDEVERDTINNVMVIKSETALLITPEQVERITEIVDNLRTAIIKN